jgi:hypothetical protein
MQAADCLIPSQNRKTAIQYDREAYKRRNLNERCVNQLNNSAELRPAYERQPEHISMLCIASSNALWIKTVNTT